jgi:DNA phosphorothioation-associated DGQHR protein 1
MNTPSRYPIIAPAIAVDQPLGQFYVTKLPARDLLEFTYSDPLTLRDGLTETNAYGLQGIQRPEKSQRLRDIARFIETAESAFPNSIILAANYSLDGVLEEDDNLRWRIEGDSDSCLKLVIPTAKKIAAIVDGQHRLHGFKLASRSRTEMELLCSVYLDLPQPYQAFLFATINFNQVKVDRSLAYELFGISLSDEPQDSWSPDKTAVFLCRKLNTDEQSPFLRRIRVAAQDANVLFHEKSTGWTVSTATVVDGILRLISTNPKRDKDEMHKRTLMGGRTRSQLSPDASPLRDLYLHNNDLAVYTAVKNFGLAADQAFWEKADGSSYIVKTVGIQALFDVLRNILAEFKKDKDLRKEYFLAALEPAQHIDFSDDFFQASGKGRTRIKNVIELARHSTQMEGLPPDDQPDYQRLLTSQP